MHELQEGYDMDSRDYFRERFDVVEQHMEHGKDQPHALEASTQMGARRRGTVRTLLLPIATLLGVLEIALGSVTPTDADDIQCGDVLGPGGRFELEHDLECPGPLQRAVTIRDGAILDLQGHIVTCTSGAVDCIILTGTGAQLLNGALGPVFHNNIVLEGDGGHTVRHVTSEAADGNIIVRSDHNQLINVYAASGINPAFSIIGNHNRLQDNIALCSKLAFDGCVAVLGHENLLINNFTTSTLQVNLPLGGFGISGNNNVLRGNRAIANEGPGVSVQVVKA
jgi:hypothetical protein